MQKYCGTYYCAIFRNSANQSKISQLEIKTKLNVILVIVTAFYPLFFFLFLVFQVWRRIYKWLNMSFQFELDISNTNYSSFSNMLIASRVQKNFRLLVWLAVSWIVWLSKNEVAFQETIFRIVEVVDRTKVLTWNWFAARIKDVQTQ